MGGILRVDTAFEGLELQPQDADGQKINSAIQDALSRAKQVASNKSMRENFEKAGRVDALPIDTSGDLTATLDRDLFPDELTLIGGKSIPDFFVGPGFYVVSAQFKELVQQFDDDQHQFEPIVVCDQLGNSVPGGPHFAMHTRVKKNSIIVDGSNLRPANASNSRQGDYSLLVFPSSPEFSAKSEEIGNAAIWREVRYPIELFASDKFIEALSSADLSGWKLHSRFDEV